MRSSSSGSDDRLPEEALRVGGHKTKKETVTEALEEYIGVGFTAVPAEF
ncbi:MAG: type II toxin-antitoxin system VapB family antitoxin [Myxococcales bacterium]|nr:type II toxin-antitoxin system VapB family antitoxin [Myxococcales bacterium]